MRKSRKDGDRILTKRFKRVIACISDAHIGTYTALFPEDFHIKKGNVISLSEGQKSLLESYYAFCKTCDELGADTVLVLGDMVHGQNPKERGENLITTELEIQKRAAKVLLKTLIKDRKSYWTAGSGYHASTPGHDPDEGLCGMLGGYWCDKVKNLKFGSRLINVSHGGSGAFIYRETAMAREIAGAKMAFANGKLPKIDLFVHGHFHWFAYLHEYDTHFLQLPCWAAFEPARIFVKNYTRFQPDIGGAVILIDDEDRITVWHYLYDLPHIADETVDCN
jgi:UDP-2,3-diacylglucosamine pyrophosphatase LpxH